VLDTALADVYEATDRSLARILEALPEDADVIVMATSRMAAENDRSDLLPGMLKTILDGGSSAASARRSGGALWSVRAAVPVSVRGRVAQVIPDEAALQITARLSTAGMDWRRTRAFAVPSEPCGAVRLNLRGRERDGIVDPAEVDELVGQIEDGLLRFRDPDGEPAVAGVERIEAIEPSGPRSHLLPDLSVRWSPRPSSGLRLVEAPGLGEVHRVGNGSGRSGNHSGEGWALLAPARSRLTTPGRPAELVDIAATACALLGAEAEREALPGEPLLEPG
jgi:predicted AlkP superfamily phosphohydrolase/phosphomutase